MILHACQYAQLAFDRYAPGMGQLDHFPGQGDVILEGQAGAVDHNGGIASVHGGDAGFHGFAVVQVEGYGDGTVFCVLFDGLGDVVRADLLIFQCCRWRSLCGRP